MQETQLLQILVLKYIYYTIRMKCKLDVKGWIMQTIF